MDGLPVYYVMQPSEDDSVNVFFLPTNFKSLAEVKIRDVVSNFPHAGNGRFYHFRFHTICDKDQKSWVDISNLNARAPVIDNRIYVKVLEISQPHHSRIFAAHYGASQNSRPPVPTQQNAREEYRSHDILNDTPTQQPRAKPEPQNQNQPFKKSVSSGDKPNPNPQTIPQQRPPQYQQPQTTQTKSTPPTNSSAHDFDLLGGDSAPDVTIKSTTTTTKVSFTVGGSAQKSKEDKSELYGMTREQLGALKQQQMDQAIQDKLNFANNLWQGEEETRLGKEKAYDEVEDAIKKWAGSNNQRNNIRALLATLHQVIWQGADWNALGLSDLMAPAQIKKNYFKAITKFHPDKNQHGDYKQKYIAERVTNELNAAWDEFRKTNP